MILAGALALAGIVAIAGAAGFDADLGRNRSRNDAEAPPAPPPLLVRQLPVDQALAINQHIAVDSGPNPAAQPFSLGKVDAATRARALECLTSAVYYEAGQESTDGQRAVAQVVLNRVRHPAFPANVCGVVYEGSTRPTGCQFTFTCDGSLTRGPALGAWQRARSVAEAALAGFVYKPVGTATHYHADYVVPYWAPTLTKNAVIGAHIFYRWAGGWGRPTRLHAGLFAPRTERGSAAFGGAHRRATRHRDARPARCGTRRRSPRSRARKCSSSRPRCAATSASRSASTWRRARPPTKIEAKPYVEKVKASDNLRWSLSGGMAAADEKPLGKAAAPSSRRLGHGDRLARVNKRLPALLIYRNGASDGARTRDLRRDRPAL